MSFGAIHTEDSHLRLAGMEKGGYRTYLPHMVEATASWFIPLPTSTCRRILDPSAGEGEIASLLGRLLGCETLRAKPSGRSLGLRAVPYRPESAVAPQVDCA